jgi:hypothetical protein
VVGEVGSRSSPILNLEAAPAAPLIRAVAAQFRLMCTPNYGKISNSALPGVNAIWLSQDSELCMWTGQAILNLYGQLGRIMGTNVQRKASEFFQDESCEICCSNRPGISRFESSGNQTILARRSVGQSVQ